MNHNFCQVITLDFESPGMFPGSGIFSVVMQSLHANTAEIFNSDPFRRAVTAAAAASGNVSNPVYLISWLIGKKQARRRRDFFCTESF